LIRCTPAKVSGLRAPSKKASKNRIAVSASQLIEAKSIASYDKGTPVARPVRKAKDLTSETAWPSKRKIGFEPVTFYDQGVAA